MCPTDTYATLGYGTKKMGLGSRPAILVVDFQRGLTDPSYPLGGCSNVSLAVEHTALLLKYARRAEVPVIHGCIAFSEGATVPLWKIDSIMLFKYHDPSTDIDARVLDPSCDTVLRKSCPSLFFQTNAYELLKKHDVDTVLVAGCATSGCVRATVTDAFSYGFYVGVPQECVADFDMEAHRNSLQDIGRRYADILTLTEAIAYLKGFHGNIGNARIES